MKNKEITPDPSQAEFSTTAGQRAAKKGISVLKSLFAARETGIALVVIVIMLILSISTPYFLTASNLAIVARQVSLSAIIAIGMTLVILLGGIDLSVGSVVALASVVIGFFMVRMDWPIWAGILSGLVVGALVGMVNGVLVVKTGVPPFIVTLGMMGLARGAALVITKGSTISGLPPAYLGVGQGYVGGYVPVPVIILLVLAVTAHLFLSRTTLGRRIYFIGSNEEAALLSGINVNLVKIIIFTLCATLAAGEAVIETARMSTAQPASGVGYELTAIGAVIIGGASMMGGEGTILGTILGATLLGLITNGLILLGVSAYWQQVFSGAIIILAVALDTWRRRRS
jgi:ribose/xylose/arabinose/galactoside ABC-type transport system permease subunit